MNYGNDQFRVIVLGLKTFVKANNMIINYSYRLMELKIEYYDNIHRVVFMRFLYYYDFTIKVVGSECEIETFSFMTKEKLKYTLTL
jgi:hypothetical protein